MRLLSIALLALTTTACAFNLGGPKDIPVSAVALRPGPGSSAGEVAWTLRDASADVALIAGAVDSAWLAEVAEATDLTVSGPAAAGDLRLAFLAGEPLGDTTVVLPYAGGALTVHDALYELEERRFLDLLALRIDDAATARPAVSALVEYMATDVMNSAAVVMAVAVPSGAVGDSVARMLSPAYFDALRCDIGLAAEDEREGIRLFYGPQARLYCESAAAEASGIGDLVRARLVLGRR